MHQYETIRWLEQRATYYDGEASKCLCEILATRAEECRQAAKLLRVHVGHAQLSSMPEPVPADRTPEQTEAYFKARFAETKS